ncbi:DNA (cytosine-5-)-methyltransferase [Limnohabitans sp.]|uniref:DNA cytosine methyltransferase n=1 Tax=Limnohabitans sp. TaxID=1907725 RepID=UPI00286F19CB|nr:DNA (cytosine-5-)-methyltransferase [Limnohabitans sp.]
MDDQKTVGSLFAGIGGFDLGFERAGFKTKWQVEINPICRAVLADRFPHARQHEDVCTVGVAELGHVDVIVGGFPCQDVSTMGARAGLAGARTGLFWQALRIVVEVRPKWLVLENVVGLLDSNDGQDFQTVLEALASCGYVGLWRVLDSSYFGVPQRRRRVFMVAGLGQHPPIDLLSDAAPVDAVPGTIGAQQQSRPADGWAACTLLAKNARSLIGLGCETLVAHPDARHQMVERARMSTDAGLCTGLDETNHAEARAAGNAVTVQVAQWVAEKLIKVV